MILWHFSIVFIWISTLHAKIINQPDDVNASSSIITELIKRVQILEARDRSQSQVIEALETKHEEEISVLKQEIVNIKDETIVLRQKSAVQERQICRLMRRMKLGAGYSFPGHEGSHNKSRKTYTENTVNRSRRAENDVTVAFTAGLTHRFTHAGAHQNIIFDHVETNVGNGYNPHHGVFTAPVAGIYVFYTSVLADNDREVWCDIVVNGKNKAAAYARGTDTRHDQGSQLIVVPLQQGGDVAVQNIAADDSIYGDTTIYSTFSGYLLQQDFSQSETIVG